MENGSHASAPQYHVSFTYQVLRAGPFFCMKSVICLIRCRSRTEGFPSSRSLNVGQSRQCSSSSNFKSKSYVKLISVSVNIHSCWTCMYKLGWRVESTEENIILSMTGKYDWVYSRRKRSNGPLSFEYEYCIALSFRLSPVSWQLLHQTKFA